MMEMINDGAEWGFPHTNNDDDDVDGDGAFTVLVRTVKKYSTFFKIVCIIHF